MSKESNLLLLVLIMRDPRQPNLQPGGVDFLFQTILKRFLDILLIIYFHYFPLE